MKRFRLAARAKVDLSGIWDYIGVVKENPTAAHHQLEVLYDKFALLAQHPLLGQSRDDLRTDLREFSAGSYVIFYCPHPDGIEVERVIHGVRDIRALF
jgi:toxin ParE1/3/4